MTEPNDVVTKPTRGPRVALAQIAPALGDIEANLQRHRQAVARAVEEGADVLVFPELSLTGYRLKDSVPDVGMRRDAAALTELAALSAQVSIVVGFVEESKEHLFFNSMAYLEDGRIVAVHRKTYLPTYGMFDEQRYFARGRAVRAFDTKHGRMAMLVCEDMLHPSTVTIAACDGATLLLVASASPARGVVAAADEEGEPTHEADANARSWEDYNRVMARTFGLWVVFCNRVGIEDGVAFWGGSQIVSPAGATLVRSAYYEEDFAVAMLPEDAVRRRRIVSPTIRDEDMDLTINELSRVRGRAVEDKRRSEPAREAQSGSRDERRSVEREHRPRPFYGGDERPRGFQGRGGDDDRPRGFKPRGRDEGPRSYGRGDDRPGGFKPRFGGGGDDRPGGFKPRFGGGDDDRRGGFKPRFGGGGDDRPGGYKPRFGGGGDDRPGGFKPRFGGGGDDRPGGYKPRFGGGGDDRRGGFKPRFGGGGDDRPGGYKPRFGGGGDDRPGGSKPRFGGGGDDRPGGYKPRFGGGGDDRPGGFKPRFGGDDDRSRAPRPRFGSGQDAGGSADRPRPRRDDEGERRPRSSAPRFGESAKDSPQPRDAHDSAASRERKRPARGERPARAMKLPRSDSEES